MEASFRSRMQCVEKTRLDIGHAFCRNVRNNLALEFKWWGENHAVHSIVHERFRGQRAAGGWPVPLH